MRTESKEKTLEVLFAPAEIASLEERDLSDTICVVFDILRATSTMVTALDHGAAAIIPVAEIAEALSVRERQSDTLLAGEREGVKIRAEMTGGVAFDLGNSPREFTPDKVRGRRIAMTTTNGTRALRACHGARSVLAGSFLNLAATVERVRKLAPENLLLVGSGTADQAAYEDVLAAGALCDLVWEDYRDGAIADSARIARRLFQIEQENLLAAVSESRNGRRLLTHAELRDDVAYCLQRDTVTLVAVMERNEVRREK